MSNELWGGKRSWESDAMGIRRKFGQKKGKTG
jgi:hypothetical protein